MWVRPLARSDASCGGKASGLARLIAAGLPVPDGFVIDDRAFRHIVGDIRIGELADIGHVLEQAAAAVATQEIPPELAAEVAALAATLAMPTGMLAVRSSASIEDGDRGGAAGVFHSAIGPLATLWSAIRAVWTSALTPLAALYARSRDARTLAIGVIVQRWIAGARVTIYTRPPGAPSRDEVWIQRDAQLERLPRDRAAHDPIVALALRAEAAIGAVDGADVELVIGDSAWVVQARPIVHPTARPRTPPPPPVLAGLVADGRVWTWDASHNPAPLSPAQAGLVERVERAGVAPWSLRVCGGYLYTAPRELAELAPIAPATAAELATRVAAIEDTLRDALGDADADLADLAATLDRYLAFYAIWARELAPLVTAAVRALPPAQLIANRPSRVRALLEAAVAGTLPEAEVIARLGVLSPAWDVAVPTFGETPHVIRDSIARARLFAARADHPAGQHLRFAEPNELARVTADLAERDDEWFYRAQRLVRRAMLVRGAELGLGLEDICWIPLEDLVAGTIDPEAARRRAAGARAAHARARQWSMPATVNAVPGEISTRSLHGTGIGPRVTGRVVRIDALLGAVAVTAGDVVVCQSVTPGLAVLVIGCAALISESRHDGLLDHGVALARELGITCVVGCHEAWSRLEDGALVTVDGDAGTVELHGARG